MNGRLGRTRLNHSLYKGLTTFFSFYLTHFDRREIKCPKNKNDEFRKTTAIKLKLISPPVNRPRLVLMLNRGQIRTRRKNKNSWVGNVAASHNPLII